MTSLRTKIRWSFSYCWRILAELVHDLWNYFVTPYPFLLILGAFRRLMRRLKIIWLPKPPGRPPIHENVIDLIIEMKRCNRIWGAQRICDELKIMGIRVSKKTILKILRENGFVPPKTKFVPPSWEALYHAYSRFWSMDFTTVFDSRGVQLFIFVIVEFPSRKLVLINVTPNPDMEWLIQQFRNCSIAGHLFPEAMVHDRDGIYGKWLPRVLREFEIKSVKTRPKSPWENPFVERFHLSLKNEMLNRLIVINSDHARDLCTSYQTHYNQFRPHQGIDGKIPDIQDRKNILESDLENFRIEKRPELNGLATHFSLAA
jgi:putative transposase